MSSVMTFLFIKNFPVFKNGEVAYSLTVIFLNLL